MNKKISKIKRVLALSLIFLFSINTFAAIVSDNDGSTFVTKDEFDALKTSFNEQIDSYNESIDDKVDGAIASYLSGIQLATTETKNILFSDWESVACIWTGGQLTKGALAPTFEYPSYNATIAFIKNWDTTTYDGSLSSYMNVSYDQNAGSRRPIINGIIEANTIDKRNACWGGIATAFYESWVLSVNCCDNNKLNYIRNTGNSLTWKTYFPRISDSKYYPNLYTTNTLLQPTYHWRHTSQDYADFGVGTPAFYSSSTSAELKENSSGKIYDHEHIISWSKNQEFYGSNPNFAKTITLLDKASGTSTLAKWDDKLSKVGKFNALEMGSPGSTAQTTDKFHQWESNQACGFDYAMGTTALIPRIGLIPAPFKFSEIKQHAETKSETIKGTVYNATPSDLSRGFQAFFEQENREIIWELEFDNDWAGDSGEVLVWVSMSPFDGDPVDTNCIDIKVNNTPTVVKKGKTIGKKIRLNWTMPETGLVWLKWRPSDDASVLSTNTTPWETTLKLSSCNKYTVIFES